MAKRNESKDAPEPERGDRPKECSIDGSTLKPCWVLDEMMEPWADAIATRHQGVKLLTFLNMSKRTKSRDVLALKSGGFSKRGIVMNFCPFCGNPCLPPTTDDCAEDKSENSMDHTP